jgi:hypothetical protein
MKKRLHARKGIWHEPIPQMQQRGMLCYFCTAEEQWGIKTEGTSFRVIRVGNGWKFRGNTLHKTLEAAREFILFSR